MVLKPQGKTGLVCRVRLDRDDAGSGASVLGSAPHMGDMECLALRHTDFDLQPTRARFWPCCV